MDVTTLPTPTDEQLLDLWLENNEPRTLHVCLGPSPVVQAFATKLSETGVAGDAVIRLDLGESPHRMSEIVTEAAARTKPKHFTLHIHPSIEHNPTTSRIADQMYVLLCRIWNRYTTSIATFSHFARTMIGGCLLNAPLYPGSLDLHALALARPGVAVVVGGGPGLDDRATMHRLRRAWRQQSVTIVAVDRALPALLDAGIQPEIAVTLDIRPDKSEILRAVTKELPGTILVQLQHTHPDLSRAWKGLRAFAADINPVCEWLPDCPVVGADAQSCGTMAVQVAAHLQPRLIALVAMEFTGRGECPNREGPRPTRDGRIVPIGMGMDSLVEDFEVTLARLDVPVWNYSLPDGVRLAGAVDPLCEMTDFVDEPHVLPIVPHPDADPAKLIDALERLAAAPQHLEGIVLYREQYERGGPDFTDEEREAARGFIRETCEQAIQEMRHGAVAKAGAVAQAVGGGNDEDGGSGEIERGGAARDRTGEA